MKRYMIRRGFLWRVPLLVIRATAESSYAEMGDHGLVIHFGNYSMEAGYDNIALVEQKKWRFIDGVGIRYEKSSGTVGCIGDTGDAVFISLRQGITADIPFIKAHVNKIAVTIEDQASFIADLKSRVRA